MLRLPRRQIAVLSVFVLLASAPVLGRHRPTITFDNRSGEDALVRLAGPTSGTVAVPDSSARTVDVQGGQYRIYVRHGQQKRYRYTKGDFFAVYEGRDRVDVITITLHR